MTLLAENNVGYKNLIQLASLAFLEGYYYQPRMDWELLTKYSAGLIATSGCLGGHVLQALKNGKDEEALKTAARLQEIFGKDNFFIELQDHGIPMQIETNPKLIEIGKNSGHRYWRQMTVTTRIAKTAHRMTRCCVCKPVAQLPTQIVSSSKATSII